MKVSHVAAVAPFDRHGRLLMGRRADDGSWCCPGGHVESGEDPHDAAHRELAEETGLKALGMMRPLDRRAVKNGEIHVHAFRADVDGEPDGADDPDAEFTEYRWVDHRALPSDIVRNLHNEPDVVLTAIGARGTPWARMDERAASDDSEAA